MLNFISLCKNSPLPNIVQSYTNHATFDHDLSIFKFKFYFSCKNSFLEENIVFFPMKQLFTLFWLNYTSTIPPLIMMWKNINCIVWGCFQTSFTFLVSIPQSSPGNYNLNKDECKLSEDPLKTSISFTGQIEVFNY